MKVEHFPSAAIHRDVAGLPDDFARTVIIKARGIQRRQRIRNRIAASAALVLLGLYFPLARHLRSSPELVASRSLPADTVLADQSASSEQAAGLRLAEATSPESAGEYLLPETPVISRFETEYSDSSWDYDPGWTVDSGSDADR